MTPETLSRMLLKLKNDGILVWEGEEIRVAKGVWERRMKEEG